MDVGLNNKNTLGDIAPEFSDVVYFIEANSNEQFSIWQDFSKESMSNIEPLSEELISLLPLEFREKVSTLNRKVSQVSRKRVDWKQISMGFGITIGQIQKKPVTLSFSFAIINDKKVCFYYCTSRMVDHTMINDWLISRFQLTHDGYTRWNHSDATNFNPAYLERIDKKPRNTVYKK